MDILPVIKWCGSKRKRSGEILSYFPKYIDTYYEPFCGGCYVLYSLLISEEKFARNFVCSDINPDLIGLWNMVKDNPSELFEEYCDMWEKLNSIPERQDKRMYFEEIRTKFNNNRDPKLFFFLMRTCTNGLPRYNKYLDFNASFHLKRGGMQPRRVKNILQKWSDALNENEVTFKCCDYKDIFYDMVEGDFAYLDPPFKNERNFMHFGKLDYDEMFNEIRILNNRGISFLLSFDGNPKENIRVPFDCYENHAYLESENTSFRKTRNGMTSEDVFENLYWN